MAGDSEREVSTMRKSQLTGDLRPVLRRARIFLDAGSPESAHELLAPLELGAFRQVDMAREMRFELVVLLVRSCRELGHTEHTVLLTRKLEVLYREASTLCIDLRAEGLGALAAWRNSRGEYSEAAALVNEFAARSGMTGLSASTFVLVSTFLVDGLLREGRLDEAEEAASVAVERADLGNAPLSSGIARNLLALALKDKGQLSDALKLLPRQLQGSLQQAHGSGLVAST